MIFASLSFKMLCTMLKASELIIYWFSDTTGCAQAFCLALGAFWIPMDDASSYVNYFLGVHFSISWAEYGRGSSGPLPGCAMPEISVMKVS